MSGAEFDAVSFRVLMSEAISVAIHKKNRLPILSVSIRSLKKFTTIIIVTITPVVKTVVL
jgi:hypothetical protein